MAVSKFFLGWDEPLLKNVSQYILSNVKKDRPIDLSSRLIVVPTRQSARKLRKELVLYCHQNRTTLLSCSIATPSFLLQNISPNIPSSSAMYTTWVKTLTEINPADYPAMFPMAPKINNTNWIYSAAAELMDLRETVFEGGYSLSDVAQKLGTDFIEADRWRDIAKLEEIFIKNLNKAGYRDPYKIKKEFIHNPVLPKNTEELIIAATPDPPFFTLKIIDKISEKIDVKILIPAPESASDMFDEYGRPIPSKWKEYPLKISDPDADIIMAADPQDQSTIIVQEISRYLGKFKANEIGIGVPDRAIIPYLQEDLRKIGLKGFDPADIPLASHKIYSLFSACVNFILTPSYRNIASLLRHTDVITYFKNSMKINPICLLAQLDKFQNTSLPSSLNDIIDLLGNTENNDFSELKRAIEWLRKFIKHPNTPEKIIFNIRNFFMEIMQGRMISPWKQEDQTFTEVAQRFNEILHEIEETLTKIEINNIEAVIKIIIAELKKQTYSQEQSDVSIDLEGWLELLWTDTPFLVVSGMNEGVVPHSRLGDVFLPDSIRQKLDLPDSSRRYARDVFITNVLINTRLKEGGKIIFICGKKDEAGEPIKPSRILFQCDDDELVKRAEKLFKDITPLRIVPPASVGFMLDPVPPVNDPPKILNVISVTSFKDYLACPFRFYLKHILEMERLCDDKQEPDALDFGILIHDILKLLGSDKNLRDTSNEKTIISVFEKELEKRITERFGKNASLPVLAAKEAAMKRLKKAVQIHLSLIRDGWKTKHTELPLSMEIENIKIKGKIDRIDIHPDNTIRIIDYKTTDAGNVAPVHVHLKKIKGNTSKAEWQIYNDSNTGEKYEWLDLQLPLYVSLLRKNNHINDETQIEVCYFTLSANLDQINISLWENFNYAVESSALHCASMIINSIKNAVFYPPAPSLANDEFESLFPYEIEKMVVFNKIMKKDFNKI